MGVRAGASLHDSTTGVAFGPVFDSVDEADNFLDWYNANEEAILDLRTLNNEQIQSWIDTWLEETGGV